MSEKTLTIKELREARDATWAAYLEACKMAPEAVAQAWADFASARQAFASAGVELHQSTPSLADLHARWMLAEDRAARTRDAVFISLADQARTAYYEAKTAAEAAHAQ